MKNTAFWIAACGGLIVLALTAWALVGLALDLVLPDTVSCLSAGETLRVGEALRAVRSVSVGAGD